MVTKIESKHGNKNKNEIKAIEVVSKSEYEKLVRKCKRLERNQDKTVQRVEDLEDTIRLMRWQDTCKNGFISNYMKLRYRPKLSEDEEKELYSDDGKHYYPIHGITLEPVGFVRDRFTKKLVKVVPYSSTMEELLNPKPGCMSYFGPNLLLLDSWVTTRKWTMTDTGNLKD